MSGPPTIASRIALIASLLLAVVFLPSPSAASQITTTPISSKPASPLAPDPDDQTLGTYIVQLKGEPLAPFASSLSRGNNGKTAHPDYTSQPARAYQTTLVNRRTAVLQSVNRTLNRTPKVLESYDVAFNGFAIELTGAEATRISKLPNIVGIQKEQVYQPTTDAGPEWIGAGQITDGSDGVFAATLLEGNLSSPSGSTLTGRATLSFDSASNNLSYTVTLPSAPAGGAAAIYRSTDDTLVSSLIATSTAGVFAGSLPLSAGDASLLSSDGLYILITSTAFPSGEISGTISGYKGEGVIVGIIDTGINTTHASFAETDADGYEFINPLGQGNYKGACDPTNLPAQSGSGSSITNPSGYNPAIQCNSKLIGAWTFAQTAPITNFDTGAPSPNDEDGHGSHTASTVAGNIIYNPEINGVDFTKISGVAPHANIIAYDVCGYLSAGSYNANCPGAALLAAVEQATTDQVDVINYSISGGTDPWYDYVEQAFLSARAAGIVVSTSAGNDGPTVSTVNHLGPWLLSVAAATHNRALKNTITDLTSGASTFPDIAGAGTTGSLPTNTELIYAGSLTPANALCGTFTSGQAATIAGKIVICDRGTYGRVEKSENVQTAGGVGFILVNDVTNGDSLVADAFPIPGVHISYSDGTALKTWLSSNPGATAQISGTTFDRSASNGDVMASFSSRGPSPDPFSNLIKPDIAAPGVDIIAAIADTDDSVGAPDDYGLLSGTSMASPHVAGAAALLAGLHPTWTPGQIQSALTTTSLTPITKEDGSTPTTFFDSGSGRVQVGEAAKAGLLLDESFDNFIAADPDLNGNLRSLNIPSMADTSCVVECSWTRTFQNPLGVAVTWTASAASATLTVSPASFTIPANGTQQVIFTLDVSGETIGDYVFNQATFSASGGVAPDAHFPIAVIPAVSTMQSGYIASSNSGIFSDSIDISTIAYSALTVDQVGLAKGTMHNLVIGDYDYDMLELDVPANTARLVADIRSSTSLDADLYIIFDSNGNLNLDITDATVCESATGAVLEYCSLDAPAAGHYWIEVDNYEASTSGGSDPINVVTAVVPQTDASNFTVTVPATNSGGEIPLELDINLPTSQVGDSWYGAYTLTETSGPTVLGKTNVDFHHVLGAPNSLAISAGNNQSAEINTNFAVPLQVVVTDDAGNPVPDATVSFSAPSTGASATFPSGNTATTDATGSASVVVKANGIIGSYAVTASTSGGSGTISNVFNLTNTHLAASLTVSAGNNQQTTVNTTFAETLQVKAVGSDDQPVSGLTVTFSAPSTGASATFPSGNTATTDANGIASVTVKANGIAGSYSVTASATGASGTITTTAQLTNGLYTVRLPVIAR